MGRKFELGDRVKWGNMVGTIIVIDTDNVPYGVWFDNSFPGGHDLNGYNPRAKYYPKAPSAEERRGKTRGYWLKGEKLVFADSQRLIISSEGKTVTATYYKDDNIVAKGIARCHPEDEFDFFIGAKIAMQRVEDTQVFVNGRYVYIGKSNKKLTRGKIYVFTNGTTMGDDGEKFPQYAPVVLSEAQDETSSFCKNFVKLV